MTQTKREMALDLSEELLADIELSRQQPPEILKKVSRLARLLDDTDAMEWLSFEMNGYTGHDGRMIAGGRHAATRSNRQARLNDEGKPTFWTNSLSRIQADIGVRTMQLQAATDASVSINSSNPNQFVQFGRGNAGERGLVAKFIAEQHELIGKIMGAIYSYVAERELELRFGAAIESAFVVVRNAVDARIAELVPAAATKLSAAFENASSGNPEHWANAASECRRLLKDLADRLRPPGDPVGVREMTDDKYINRLIDWITTQQLGGTLRDVITSDLEDFGKRIDAFDDAGHKGAPAEVTQYEASRFITGTYLLVGDILSL